MHDIVATAATGTEIPDRLVLCRRGGPWSGHGRVRFFIGPAEPARL